MALYFSHVFLQFHFDMNPTQFPDGANQAQVSGGQYFQVATRGLVVASLPTGMFINDVAIDPDNGDAYFTDSWNCSATMSKHC